jgi:uncharacterized cupredoxin-like copper-binding protein
MVGLRGLALAWLLAAVVAGACLSAGTADSPAGGSMEHGQAGEHRAVAHGTSHDPLVDMAQAPGHALGQPASPAMPARAQDAPPDRTITLRTEGSNLDFEPRQISATAGTRLRVVYVNDGVLPHNFVLLRDENDLVILGLASYQAEDTGFVPVAEHADKIIAYTALASPGETVEVTFEVPPPGEYLFACIFPGHYNVMIGTLRSLP